MPGGVKALAPAISVAKAATVAGILDIKNVSEKRPRFLLWYGDGSIPTSFTTRNCTLQNKVRGRPWFPPFKILEKRLQRVETRMNSSFTPQSLSRMRVQVLWIPQL